MILKDGIVKRIHINQHNIKHNRNHPEDPKPVMTVKHSRGNEKGDFVKINGPSFVMYSPEKPLSCGARVWIQTEAEVEIIND